MRLAIKILQFVSLVIITIAFSCTNNEKKVVVFENEVQKDTLVYDPFQNLHLSRSVFTGKDSLALAPFEIYIELELEDLERGMFDALVFKTSVKSLPKINLKLKKEELATSDGTDENNCVFVNLESPNYEEKLKRKILYNKVYHAIVCYEVDRVAASGAATCNFSTYCLIDIVPKGALFKKQTITY